MPLTGVHVLTVTFTDESVGDIESRSWDFGDGNTSTTQNPVHTYGAEGVYTVTLTVTGDKGVDTFSDTVTVTTE